MNLRTITHHRLIYFLNPQPPPYRWPLSSSIYLRKNTFPSDGNLFMLRSFAKRNEKIEAKDTKTKRNSYRIAVNFINCKRKKKRKRKNFYCTNETRSDLSSLRFTLDFRHWSEREAIFLIIRDEKWYLRSTWRAFFFLLMNEEEIKLVDLMKVGMTHEVANPMDRLMSLIFRFSRDFF